MPKPQVSRQQGAAEATKEPSDPKIYEAQISKARDELISIAKSSESANYRHAVTAMQAIERLEQDFQDIKSREEIYMDLSAGHPWGARTVKKGVLAVQKVFEFEMHEIAISPYSGYTQVVDIALCRLPNDAKRSLLREVYAHDKATPEHPYTVQEVRAKIAELLEKDPAKKDWHKDTDFWEFPDHDPKFGIDGYPGRIPGQAVLNILSRWLPQGGVFLNAMCGGGTALDACRSLKITDKYYGFDLTPSEAVMKRHKDRVVQFDAIDNQGHWTGIGLPEYADACDLVLVTPPHFNFHALAMSGKPTDLGNITNPSDYIAVWKAICGGVRSVLRTNAVVAVVTRNTSEFDDGTPVPDIESGILGTMHEFGLTDMFLARPIVRVRQEAPKPLSEEKPYLVPEIQTIHIFRVSG